MGIPASGLRERHFQPDLGLDQEGDLPQGVAQRAARIARFRRRPVAGDIEALEGLDRLEGLLGRGPQQAPGGLLVQGLESLARRLCQALRAGHVDLERAQVGGGDRRLIAVQRPRQRAGHRHRAERRGVVSELSGHPIEPAVGCPLAARRAGLHVVLGIEMRAGRIRRAHRVDRGQPPVAPIRQEGRERRMQPEADAQIVHRFVAGAPAGIHGQARTQARQTGAAQRRQGHQTVHGTTLEEGDQDLAPSEGTGLGGRGGRALQEGRPGPQGNQGDAARLEKRSAIDHVASRC